MAHIHEIGIASDTKAFEQGIRSGVIRPAEDAVKAFEKFGDSIDKPDYSNVLSDLEGDLKDVGTAAERAGRDGEKGVERLEEALRDAQKETEDLGRKTRDAGDDAEQSYRRMGAAGEEVSGELRQNLGETFSSFRGDLEDLPQIAQDVFGGIAGSVGGLVPAIGLAAGAAGVGLLIAAFEAAEERREQLTERANDLANVYIEAGTNVMNAMSIAARTAEIITGDEREEAQRYAQVLGVDLPTAARAMAGDANALATVNAISAAATRDAKEAANEQRDSLKALTPEQQAKVRADLEAINAARELNGVVADATQKFNDQQGVLKGLITDADSAALSVDELGNQVYELPDGTQIMIDAETGQASADVSKFKGDTDGVIEQLNQKQVKMRVDFDDSAIRNYRPATLRVPMEVVLGNGRIAQY